MSKQILSQFTSSKNFPAEKVLSVYLFGSRARGDAKKDSDYDLLIIVTNDFTHQDKDSLYQSVMDVLMDTGKVLSLKIFNKKEYQDLVRQKTPFIQNVLRDGVLIG